MILEAEYVQSAARQAPAPPITCRRPPFAYALRAVGSAGGAQTESATPLRSSRSSRAGKDSESCLPAVYSALNHSLLRPSARSIEKALCFTGQVRCLFSVFGSRARRLFVRYFGVWDGRFVEGHGLKPCRKEYQKPRALAPEDGGERLSRKP